MGFPFISTSLVLGHDILWLLLRDLLGAHHIFLGQV